MKFELDEFHRNVSDDELIQDLQRVAKEINRTKVTIDEYNERGKYHNTTLTRRFGSWFKCLELAGLEPTRSRLNITIEKLFENLEEVWIKLGRQPRYNDMNTQISKYSAGTYENRFGRWRKALETFVIYINKNVSDFKEEIESKNYEKDSRHKTQRNINWRLRFIVMRRDNFKCVVCGASPAKNPAVLLHVDHIVPWSKGGETILENLQTLCLKCNIGKSDLDMYE